MIIAKFGGTSVSSFAKIQNICQIVTNERKRNPIVVVSALTGVTDLLLSLDNKSQKNIKAIRKLHVSLINSIWTGKEAKKLIAYIDLVLKEVSKHITRKKTKALQDKIASYGEIMSSYIIASAFTKNGLRTKQVIATDCIITDQSFGSAEFLVEPTRKKVKLVLLPLITKGIVPVVTGFIGATINGKTTTLGRGGSDYTASIIGFCLNAEEIQIWTDVDGIMTADPRVVKNAKTVELISYDEASELAVLGAKILHPKTILPAIEKDIPVKVLNTHNPTYKGTTILREVHKQNYITSIACKKGIKLIDIRTPNMLLMYGFLHKIFSVFDKLKISVDFVSTSETSISLTIDGKYNTKGLVAKLSSLADIKVKNNHATVSVVGKQARVSPVIPGVVYTLLEKANIDVEMISAGASKVNETIVIKEEDADEVVKLLHNALITKGKIL